MVTKILKKALIKIAGFMIVVLTLVNILISYGCNTKNDVDKNVVAEFGNGEKVTFEELSRYTIDKLYNKKYRVKSEAFDHSLKDLVEDQMKRVDFFESHLDTNKALLQDINRSINEALVANYFEKEYLRKYTTDEFAKKVYGIMDKRVAYREIVLKKPEGASKSDLSKLEKKAINIKEEIESGTDFSTMVQKYSQDEQSAKNNGNNLPIAWMQSLSDPLGNVIFNLKEHELKVLNTNNDYRIIEVTGINKVPVEPFEKVKDKLFKDIQKVYAQRSLDEFNKDKEALLDTSSIIWNEAALKQLVNWSNEIPTFNSYAFEDNIKSIISKTDNKTIMTYSTGKVDYKEFVWLIKNVLTLNAKRKLTESDIKYFIKEAVTTEKIVKKADSLGLRKEFFNANTNDPEIKDGLVYIYNQAMIEQKIPPLTEDNLHNFYNDNKTSIFYNLKKVNLYAMIFSDKKEAKKVSDKIKAGTEFEKVIGRFFVKTYVEERNGEFKSYVGKEKPIFAEKAFKMKQGEVSGPFEFTDVDGQNKYAILKCKYIRPAKQLTYDDAKKTIGEQFKKFYRIKLENEIKQMLNEKYHPKYYYDVVSKMISSK